MATVKQMVKKSKLPRTRRSPEFKASALARAAAVGVGPAARELGLSESQLYQWKQQQERVRLRDAAADSKDAEIARLRRQVAEQTEELAILKKAAAYFARNQK